MMKFTWIVILSSAFSFWACSTKKPFHADHTVFGVNKLEPHADFFAYESAGIGHIKNNLKIQRIFSL